MRLGAVIGALLLLVAACGGSAGDRQKVTVFAASSLTDVFKEVAAAFQDARSGAEVTLNFAATSTLRAQLEEGARADLFASADQLQMELARNAGVLDGEPVLFATNRLAIVAPAGDQKVKALRDLAQPRLRLILGTPQSPIGAYTEEALRRIAADERYGAEFVQQVRSNVVTYGLNARQATAIVQLGEADAAIAYVTDAGVRGGSALRAMPLPSEFAGTPLYPIALVRDSSARDLAQAFIDFLRSEEGLRILERHGFGRP